MFIPFFLSSFPFKPTFRRILPSFFRVYKPILQNFKIITNRGWSLFISPTIIQSKIQIQNKQPIINRNNNSLTSKGQWRRQTKCFLSLSLSVLFGYVLIFRFLHDPRAAFHYFQLIIIITFRWTPCIWFNRESNPGNF